MKRKITDLEKKLLENGYILVGKDYSGKHSEKTNFYTYKSGSGVIKIDYTRTKVVDFALTGYFIVGVVSGRDLAILNSEYKELENFVTSLTNSYTKETTNVPNSELDEREELGSMTPEQFDELCQEKEKE